MAALLKEEVQLKRNNTVSDYRPIEHENGNSIFSTVLYTEFQNKKINILDTPGLDDFSGGVISSLFASDAAVMTINVQNGVEVGTEIHFRHAEKENKPLIIVINGLDHEKANFEKSLEMLKERLSSNVVLIQYPVNEGIGFNSIIDVLKMKMLRYAKRGRKSRSSLIFRLIRQPKQLNCIALWLKKQLKAMKHLWNCSLQMILLPKKK